MNEIRQIGNKNIRIIYNEEISNATDDDWFISNLADIYEHILNSLYKRNSSVNIVCQLDNGS